MNLSGTPGELRLTLEITRKATGKTETVELIGTPIIEEEQNERNPQHGSEERRD